MTLKTTDWTFAALSADSPLHAVGGQVVKQGPQSCRTFADCGSVSMVVALDAAGAGHVIATRKRCGELRYCDRSASRFELLVTVTG